MTKDEALKLAQYSGIVSDGGLDPRNPQPKANREEEIQSVIKAAKHYTSSTHEYRWSRELQDAAYHALEAAIRKLAKGAI